MATKKKIKPFKIVRLDTENDSIAISAANRYMRSITDRDDRYQEARLAVIRSERTFKADRGTKFCSYAFNGVRMHSCVLWKKQKKLDLIETVSGPEFTEEGSVEIVENQPEDAKDPSVMADAKDVWDIAMKCLPEHTKRVILRKYLDGYRNHEIAKELGISNQRIGQLVNEGHEIIKGEISKRCSSNLLKAALPELSRNSTAPASTAPVKPSKSVVRNTKYKVNRLRASRNRQLASVR